MTAALAPKFSRSTKPAPHLFLLAAGTGQHRLFPASGCAPPIHSKTACRGFKSFCPCQKSQVSLLRYLTFSLVCGKIWQRGAPAGSPAVRVVGACSPVGCVQARPSRQARQVRCLSMPVFPSVRTRCTSLQHPERTRFRLFRAESGAFRCFCPLLTCKIFGSSFVHFVA